MNRYLVFAYDNYYPEGGWNDFSGHFHTVDEALEHIYQLHSNEYAHVVDSANGSLIAGTRRDSRTQQWIEI